MDLTLNCLFLYLSSATLKKESKMRRYVRIRFLLFFALSVCVIGFIAHQEAVREPQYPTSKPIKVQESDLYEPYTEQELRRLVKDYTTHESVIYNASKSMLKYPTNKSILENWVRNVKKREHVLTESQLFACFALAAKDSGSDREKFLKVFQDLYSTK